MRLPPTSSSASYTALWPPWQTAATPRLRCPLSVAASRHAAPRVVQSSVVPSPSLRVSHPLALSRVPGGSPLWRPRSRTKNPRRPRRLLLRAQLRRPTVARPGPPWPPRVPTRCRARRRCSTFPHRTPRRRHTRTPQLSLPRHLAVPLRPSRSLLAAEHPRPRSARPKNRASQSSSHRTRSARRRRTAAGCGASGRLSHFSFSPRPRSPSKRAVALSPSSLPFATLALSAIDL